MLKNGNNTNLGTNRFCRRNLIYRVVEPSSIVPTERYVIECNFVFLWNPTRPALWWKSNCIVIGSVSSIQHFSPKTRTFLIMFYPFFVIYLFYFLRFLKNKFANKFEISSVHFFFLFSFTFNVDCVFNAQLKPKLYENILIIEISLIGNTKISFLKSLSALLIQWQAEFYL